MDTKKKQDKTEDKDRIVFSSGIHNILIVFVSYLVDGG